MVPPVKVNGREIIMAKLELYSKRNGNVQNQGGLNWGFSDGHVCTDDAYVAITHSFISKYPDFFPSTDCNRKIKVIWDDGTQMICSVEGTQEIDGKLYPKQLTSADDKSLFGEYIRGRMGLPSGKRIDMDDLDAYGRRDIEIDKTENAYYIDFSV